MAELARGSVADRPWGRTLGTLAARGLTGQVVLASEGKQYAIAFQQGIVVAAWSPLQADSGVRLALTGGLVSSTQVADIARRTAAEPHRDEIDVITEYVRLAPDQAMRLRRRAIAQRAARTFSVDRGEFVVDDRITLPTVPGTELDIRSVIYIGARQLLAEQRLDAEIQQFGAWFRLRREILRDLPQFGFTDAERPVLDRLLNGAWLVELDGLGVDARTTRAMVYALASCNGCEAANEHDAPSPRPAPPQPARTTSNPGMRPIGGQRNPTPVAMQGSSPNMRAPTPPAGAPSSPGMRMPTPVPGGRVPTPPPGPPSNPGMRMPTPTPGPPSSSGIRTPPPGPPSNPNMRMPTPPVGSPSSPAPRAPTPPAGSQSSAGLRIPSAASGSQPGMRPVQPAVQAAAPRTPTRDVDAPTIRRSSTQSDASPRRGAPSQSPTLLQRKRSDSAQAVDIRALIAQRVALIDQQADHYKLLGVHSDAKDEDVRKAYFALARQLHPDKLAALDIEDDTKQAQRLFAQVNAAFATLSDPKRRSDYTSVLKRGGEAGVKAEQAKAEQAMQRALDAEAAFERGEAALKRDQFAAAIQDLQRAIQLDPEAADYHATLAWAQFCAAADKTAVAGAARRALERAIERGPQSVTARFYLGRVERILGRDQDALRYFREVLSIEPRHTEAAGEARMIEARLGGSRRR